MGVDGVPVDVLPVPVGLVASSEDDGDACDVALGGDDEQTVVGLDTGIGIGEDDLAVTP